MKKYNKIIISSIVMMAVAFSPLTSFAHADKGHSDSKSKSSQGIIVRKSVPVISGITAPTVLRAGETGTWTVNAFDRDNGPLSYSVDWGDSVGLLRSLFAEPIFVQTSTFDHAYANPGTYTVKFVVTNGNGMKTTSTATVRILPPLAGIPVITNASATSDKPAKASVSWTTDVKSNSKVWFSTSTPVDTSGSPNVSKGDKTMDHKINLNKLQPDTTYFVVAGSANKTGTGKSSELSFKTPPKVNNKAPVIVSIVGSPIPTVVAGEVETVTLNAFDPKNTALTYSVDWGDTLTLRARLNKLEDIFVQTTTFDHVYDLAGVYTAVFKVRNAAGLETSGSLVITVTEPAADTIAPVISGVPADITAEAEDAGGTIVNYTNPTAVDNVDGEVAVNCIQASNSTFPIGTTTVRCSASDSSGNSSSAIFAVTVADTTAPVITLNGIAVVNLNAGDVYAELGAVAEDSVDTAVAVVISGDTVNTAVAGTYLVRYDATDAAGNHAVQVVRTVIVSPVVVDTTAPIISGISQSIGSTLNTISWNTDEPSNSIIFYSTTSPVDVGGISTPFVSNGAMVTNHSLGISGLTPNTFYHFVIESVDPGLNVAKSSELDFTTNS